MSDIINKMCNLKQNLQIMILYISILSCTSLLLLINHRQLKYISRAQAEGLSCFKCLKTLIKPEDSELLCTHFDGSAKFQTYCPASTLCMKKTIQYRSKSSVVTTVLRDCAPQKYISQNYNDADRQWYKKEEVIESAYDEGCFIGEHRGAPTDAPEYCFCSFHLCNSSPVQIGILNKICGTILTLLIIKLL